MAPCAACTQASTEVLGLPTERSCRGQCRMSFSTAPVMRHDPVVRPAAATGNRGPTAAGSGMPALEMTLRRPGSRMPNGVHAPLCPQPLPLGLKGGR